MSYFISIYSSSFIFFILFFFIFFFFFFIFLSLSFDTFPCTCVGLRTSRLLVFVRLESENDRQRRTRLSRVSSRFKTHYSVSHVRVLSFLPRVGVYTSGVYEMTRALSSSFQWTLLLSTFKVPTIHQEWILLSTHFIFFFLFPFALSFSSTSPRLLSLLSPFFIFFFHLSFHSYLFTWIIKSMQQQLPYYMKSKTFFVSNQIFLFKYIFNILFNNCLFLNIKNSTIFNVSNFFIEKKKNFCSIRKPAKVLEINMASIGLVDPYEIDSICLMSLFLHLSNLYRLK